MSTLKVFYKGSTEDNTIIPFVNDESGKMINIKKYEGKNLFKLDGKDYTLDWPIKGYDSSASKCLKEYTKESFVLFALMEGKILVTNKKEKVVSKKISIPKKITITKEGDAIYKCIEFKDKSVLHVYVYHNGFKECFVG